MYLPPNPKLCLMKSSMKRSGFGFQTWKFQKPRLNLGQTLDLTMIQMGIKIQKNQKNEKPKHIVFLCHIVSIQVDKQGLDIFKPEKSCIYPLTLNYIL